MYIHESLSILTGFINLLVSKLDPMHTIMDSHLSAVDKLQQVRLPQQQPQLQQRPLPLQRRLQQQQLLLQLQPPQLLPRQQLAQQLSLSEQKTNVTVKVIRKRIRKIKIKTNSIMRVEIANTTTLVFINSKNTQRT